MKVEKIDHIAIAVDDIDKAIDMFKNVLGLVSGQVFEDKFDKVKAAAIPIGKSMIELDESTDPNGPIAKFIAKRGAGLHHLAVRVEDIDEALKELKEKGIELIDKEPRVTPTGSRTAFIHPKSSGGVLIQLTER